MSVEVISRREFMAAAAMATAIGATTVACGTPKGNRGASVKTEDLLELSAVDAVAAMQKGTVMAEVYAKALLEQCERGKKLNVFITLNADQVLKEARAADERRKAGAKLGPLHGLPIPVKDSVNTKDLPTTAGTPALRTFRPKEDAPVVKALRDAGAIVLGKTNLHELSMGWTSNNLAFGAVHNPYDARRIPGGSSGGTAVAVAARMAPLGVAEDTEGSIRVPAALCGLVGFRPTTGRYSSKGVAPISHLFDQVGPHARTVADIVLFDSVVAVRSGAITPLPLKGVKLAVPRGYFYAGLDAEVERITHEALEKLHGAGVEFVEADIPGLAELIETTTLQVQLHDVWVTMPEYLRESGASVTFEQVLSAASRDIQDSFISIGKGGPYFVAQAVYRAAVDTNLPKLKVAYREYFERTGAVAAVFPAVMMPATVIGDEQQIEVAGKKVMFDDAVSRNIAPGSTAGLPGLILPAGLTKGGLPVSLEFDGAAGTDERMLALGYSVESVLGRLPAPTL